MPTTQLSTSSQKLILDIARTSIKAEMDRSISVSFDIDDPVLMSCCGLFVSLYEQGQLRGCIGTITSDQPLYKLVTEMAVAAATRDPRFPPVRADEIGDLEIELSVLTPLELVVDITEIEIGRHGLYITQDQQNGLLLPQVAVTHRLDRLSFLAQTCLKADLPADAWQSEQTQIYRFSAEVFSEQE
ncbi:MAG: AmmeMemoRadiSam system protein A [Candidatus Poribacteria bacterium]|jgi:AmmeMemoRadiSam system protein A|nr:AmmeMemoRadiSam system protein A [Candidatus Poribacteria bacterium]MDP6747494.1 AmmeMemoRadiSam system protein A [Candidatus Poribacteria bacterium]MDP6996580.1 AmmeMemoRadiSam system protein A [Candidatus Poribacteria bacterium]MDP7278426.1 AmmeMemoRadiSam system protein A [Candidatus Poribacteria bacterium]